MGSFYNKILTFAGQLRGAVAAKADSAAIAPEFDATASYAVGDVVMHEGARYKCTTAHSGAWNAANWTAESVETAKADASALRYALGVTITASATLADRTCNAVIPAADNTNAVTLSFPAAVSGYARDFCVLVTNTTGNTGAISFTTPTGATIYGDGFGTIPASGETYLYSVTEVAANTFYVRAQKMEVPS
ncbi:MAG: hypothetical protein IIZ06_07500 [Kiritimatiellae bacterium]|nr:hypothetical protein [Kiritimatiellia bacterium]